MKITPLTKYQFLAIKTFFKKIEISKLKHSKFSLKIEQGLKDNQSLKIALFKYVYFPINAIIKAAEF